LDVEANVAAEARPTPPDRPWVLVNMVASVDGASAGGDTKSGSLSGPGDRRLFHALRSIADVVLAGAGTIRAENYGAPRGPGPGPRLAVTSGSLALEPTARFFQEPELRPIVLTTDEAVRSGRAEPLLAVAEVRQVGERLVDLGLALRLLREEFATEILLVEGGPTLNGQLFALDLVDELRVTVSPVVVGGGSRRIVADAPLTGQFPLTLASVLEDDGFLFLRYLRDRH
jgi:riboflavin biosynthesis pyrimidine reductase